MGKISIPDPADMEKLLADLDAVDFDDLREGFHGTTVSGEQWEKYQMVAKALLAAKNQGRGIVKVNYLTTPDPLSEYAGVMVVLDKASAFDGDAKAALILAASMCDRISITTNGDKVRVSFTVDNIFEDGGNHHEN